MVSTKEPHQRETRLTRPAGPVATQWQGQQTTGYQTDGVRYVRFVWFDDRMAQTVAGRTPSVIAAVRLDDVALEPSPIDPTWILDGMPMARDGRWTQSLDGTTTHWVWDCTAGTFNWYFALEETIQIREGEVTVSSADQPPRTLRAGDAAVFPAHAWAQWHIPRYVRKPAVLRPHAPRPIRIPMRVHGAVASAMRPRSLRGALSG